MKISTVFKPLFLAVMLAAGGVAAANNLQFDGSLATFPEPESFTVFLAVVGLLVAMVCRGSSTNI